MNYEIKNQVKIEQLKMKKLFKNTTKPTNNDLYIYTQTKILF